MPKMRPSIVARGMVARAGIKPYPLSLTFELTWLCNLACGYCDRHTPMRREMTREEILSALGQFHSMGMRETNLDGGDPLTHPHAGEIVDLLAGLGVTVSMNTNGILVPARIAIVRKVSRIKISLDGPREQHDGMRGERAFERALAGAKAALDAGVPVEFSCTVGRHNAACVEEVVDLAEDLGTSVVFQPALNSLFNDTDRDGSSWQLDAASIRAAFARIEQLKRGGRAVGNAWSSLRHFRAFPEPARPPCAAGWVIATMDPEGVLFSCGQLNRGDRSNSVVQLGAAEAFARLTRKGCDQCWCARLVEANYQWGLRIDRMLPLRSPAAA
jgi:MoaA/NifB/PqqE/SkfB family radical SAM enzyme